MTAYKVILLTDDDTAGRAAHIAAFSRGGDSWTVTTRSSAAIPTDWSTWDVAVISRTLSYSVVADVTHIPIPTLMLQQSTFPASTSEPIFSSDSNSGARNTIRITGGTHPMQVEAAAIASSSAWTTNDTTIATVCNGTDTAIESSGADNDVVNLAEQDNNSGRLSWWCIEEGATVGAGITVSRRRVGWTYNKNGWYAPALAGVEASLRWLVEAIDPLSSPHSITGSGVLAVTGRGAVTHAAGHPISAGQTLAVTGRGAVTHAASHTVGAGAALAVTGRGAVVLGSPHPITQTATLAITGDGAVALSTGTDVTDGAALAITGRGVLDLAGSTGIGDGQALAITAAGAVTLSTGLDLTAGSALAVTGGGSLTEAVGHAATGTAALAVTGGGAVTLTVVHHLAAGAALAVSGSGDATLGTTQALTAGAALAVTAGGDLDLGEGLDLTDGQALALAAAGLLVLAATWTQFIRLTDRRSRGATLTTCVGGPGPITSREPHS